MIGYLGPAFTNTHEAALRLFGEQAQLTPYPSISRVFEGIEQGEIEAGVLPIENSIEGTVRETVDGLIVSKAFISRELELPIEHCLARRDVASLEGAKRVLSHPQALSQCRRWLDVHCPALERVPVSSTAKAAHHALAEGDVVAIAPRSAAEALGLVVLESNISDRSDNATRFVVVGPVDAAPSTPGAGPDKTSLVFVAPHERGGLRKVLGVFDDAGVNLTRIESRPLVGLHGPRWEYAFVIDAEGHRAEPPLRGALASLERSGALVKVLGSYPRAAATGTQALDVSGGTSRPP